MSAEPSPTSPADSTIPPRPPFASRVLKWLLILIGAVVALVVAYFVFALNYSYSTGERAGYVQKFSRKGWVCKTWEGELATVTLPGAIPERFEFSVRDEAIARQVSETMGDRVVLTYEQHPGLPSCFAETSSFVTAVRQKAGGEAPVPPVAPTAPAAPSPTPQQ